MKRKLAQIALTNDCNLQCSYCPIERWRNLPCPTPLTNHLIMKWLQKYPADEWYVELTGGEPTLYNGFAELLTLLSSAGYEGLIKTNGTHFIPKTKGFLRIVAFHNAHLPPPLWYDYVLVIDNEMKADYCIHHNIPYKTISYHDKVKNTVSYPTPEHSFTHLVFLDPNSKVHPCQGSMEYMPMFCENYNRAICSKCKTITDFEIFIKELPCIE